jgi:hypothetical protein
MHVVIVCVSLRVFIAFNYRVITLHWLVVNCLFVSLFSKECNYKHNIHNIIYKEVIEADIVIDPC